MSEVSIEKFLENLEDMVFLINQEGRLLYTNGAVSKKLGYSLEELSDTHIHTITAGDKIEETTKLISDGLTGRIENAPLSLLRKDGTVLPANMKFWRGKRNNKHYLLAITKTLSEEKEAPNGEIYNNRVNFDKEVSTSEAQNVNLNNTKPSVLIVDDQLFNLKFLESVLKEDYTVMTARNGKEALKIAKSKRQPDIILLDVVMPEMDGYEVNVRLKEMPETKDIPVVLLTALKSEKNEEHAFQMGAVDFITKPFSIPVIKCRLKNHVSQKKSRDRQREKSYIDELTRIPNRRKFNECIAIEWKRARRNKSYLSVLIVDVDLFKKYNDFYGHIEGDKCLYQIAQTLQANIMRPTDLVIRWGGEEFACILTDTDRFGAVLVGERLRKAIADLEIPSALSENDQFVTISIGVATVLPTGENSVEELLKEADEAVYKAKRNGRNRVCTKDLCCDKKG